MALDGKVVLVTGAARGMGREYVKGFLREGARVVAADVSWAPTGVSSDDVDFAARPVDLSPLRRSARIAARALHDRHTRPAL